ncbi:FecR family protein [Niastella yeongjuensis]|nr:FecR domain-containing protein [Niastella yeongjuensis]SEN84466.1 FecR family protein [Niastella yeongjuensis]
MTKDRLQYLLDRFLTNTATEEELQEYADWYRQQGETGAPLFGNESNEPAIEYKSSLFRSIINNIQLVEYEQRQGAVVRRIRFIKIAAAALVVITGTLVLYNSLSTKSAASAAGKPVVAQLPVVNMVIKKNTNPGQDTLTLPDNSIVLLAPGSSIRYQEHFEAHARNIQLQGRALFEVSHDSTKPFTVTANGFATTALGTRFIVDGTRHVVSIRLLKGKVVVNATADAGMALQKVYLTPGQELRINTATKHFDRINTGSKQLSNRMTDGDNGVALSFEKTSLAVVFERLSKYYKTPILYDKAEVQGLSFTGDFGPADELDLALKVICNINHLSFKKEQDRIVISKQ